MTKIVEIAVPDIGGFENVDVIEILVKAGDTVAAEQSLITLESDKATMEIPAPQPGVVKALKVKVGDKVSEGALILTLEPAQAVAPQPEEAAPPPALTPSPSPASGRGENEMHADVVVLGAGPGGYTAAFRAADLGKKVVLIERYPSLGGVCLNVGCIPSKALLHVAKVITEAAEIGAHGVTFAAPQIDIDKIRSWKESVVAKLTGGLAQLARQRNVTVVRGVGRFIAPHHIRVAAEDGERDISFDNAIIAAGSQAVRIPSFPDDPRIMDSSGALALADVPKKMLVIGGGIIGLEMATVYDALGSKITVVELGEQLAPGADPDLVKPLHKRIASRYEAIHLKTKVAALEAKKNGILATFDGANAPAPQLFDRVLLAVGRRPNGKAIGAEHAGITVTEQGFIPVDRQQRTNVPHIFAIGDIVGQPMLAHKAVHEGKVAAEVIAGHKAAFDARAIPSVAYTDPEIAWMGLTETEAKAQGIEIEKASFPWAASGRALSMGADNGATKMIFEKGSRRLLGAGMVGANAGELIAEAVLALEMGADAQDIGLTIHPHPTLSETLCFAAEMAEGTITDLYIKRK